MAILIECPNCRNRQGINNGRNQDDNEEILCKKCQTSLSKFSGKVYWIEYYDQDGRRRRERIGTNRSLAETVHSKRLVERAEGKLLDRKKISKVKFSELGKQYDEWSQANNKSYHVNKRYYISKVREHFDSMLLREITAWHIEKFKLDRSKETGKTEVNRELATLKHMLSKAVEWGKIQSHQARTVKKFKEPKGRLRFLMPDEFWRLCEHLPSPLSEMAHVAVLTGLRKENILGLQWPHIDFNTNIINIPETKNSEPLKIPISPPLKTLLGSIKRHPKSDYVFHQGDGTRYQNINFDFFREALRKAKLDEGIHFHDLRHTAASHMVMSGTDLATVKEILGHKDISMTLRYSHLAPDHKRKAMENLGVIFSMDTYMDTKAELEEKRVIAFPR